MIGLGNFVLYIYMYYLQIIFQILQGFLLLLLFYYWFGESADQDKKII